MTCTQDLHESWKGTPAFTENTTPIGLLGSDVKSLALFNCLHCASTLAVPVEQPRSNHGD